MSNQNNYSAQQQQSQQSQQPSEIKPRQNSQEDDNAFKEKTGYSRNEHNLGEGTTTSVKVHHPPGGKSNFTLG